MGDGGVEDALDEDQESIASWDPAEALSEEEDDENDVSILSEDRLRRKVAQEKASRKKRRKPGRPLLDSLNADPLWEKESFS